jgi:EmrB/QacA subfamily drug resistance transporter
MSDQPAVERRMTPKQRWVLGLSSLASFMISLDSLVVSTALPTIHRYLHASLGSLEWTVNAYNLTFAVLLLTGTALGDRFGRRRIFVAGLAVFVLASAACALAPTVGVLIAARAVQGVGAALTMPMALTQVSAAFPAQQRGRALGLFIGITGLATFLGPFVGGLLAQQLSWQWIFWINLPLGVLGIVLVLARIEQSFGPNTRFDLVGVALVTVGALGIVWGLVVANDAGWGSAQVLGTLGAGVVFVVLFALWERRASAPILPLRFFRLRAFSFANVASFFLFAQVYGTNFMLAQFLQNALGNGPLGAGLRMMPLTVTVLIIAPIAGTLADRFGERTLIVAGMALQAVGTGVFAFSATTNMGYPALIIPLAVGACGSTLAIPSTQKAVVSSVKLEDIGKASGAVSMLRYFGGVFGIAILGAIFAGYGSYSSPNAFTAGFVPVMWTIAIFAGLAAVAGVGIPGRSRVPAVVAPPRPAPVSAESNHSS